jgi:mannose-6-phosphate isomerase
MIKDYSKLDSFVIYMCLDGEFEIAYGAQEAIRVTKGESILIPAELKNLILKPKAKVEMLEVYI